MRRSGKSDSPGIKAAKCHLATVRYTEVLVHKTIDSEDRILKKNHIGAQLVQSIKERHA